MIQQHGGNISRLENILDFSANINPLGVLDSVKKAILECIPNIEKYPDPYCIELRSKLSEYENISAQHIVCGNGADDLIFRIIYAFKPKKALICAPTFSEYSRALEECGCEITVHHLDEENNFDITDSFFYDFDESIDMCILSAPNNPTGRLITPDLQEAIVKKCKNNGTILVCDECFMGFVKNEEDYTFKNYLSENIIILKAFTKTFAMPGIRLGYAVCGDSSAAEIIQNIGQFWSVSSIAQEAGIAALDELDHLRRSAEYIEEERDYLYEELRSMKIKVFESSANFLLFRSISDLAEKLLGYNILIRDCRNFRGLTEGFYRIAVRTHEENIKMIAALRRCLNG
ncbi:MAG TPA: histidinol-phosphate transaminase [Ruminococcus sp.]|nr:histidinol-phosphate transaminase [Ruminococcus sp.]